MRLLHSYPIIDYRFLIQRLFPYLSLQLVISSWAKEFSGPTGERQPAEMLFVQTWPCNQLIIKFQVRRERERRKMHLREEHEVDQA